MKNIVKFLSILLCLVLFLASFTSCVKNTDDPADPTATPEATVDDEPETTAIVGKVCGIPIYESEFYYFLYQGIREFYYDADIYDETLTEEENLQKMKEYFYSKAEDGETYLSKVAKRTMEIAQGFKIAYIQGKAKAETNEKYAISEDYIEQILSYIDSEADYGSSVYGVTRDEYFFYAYGMNVNDAKRYSIAQLYASVHEEVWADEAGYSIGVEEPEKVTEPVAPTDPGEDASADAKAQYLVDLAKYNEEVASYETKLAEYNTKKAEYDKAAAEYWEKFREEFNDNYDSFTIKTVRLLFLDKLDEDGKNLTEEQVAEKMKTAEKCVSLVKSGDLSFEGVVKGFSESSTVSSDLGLSDINIYKGSVSVPEKVANWAIDQKSLSEVPEIIETDDGIYVVMVVGITDFDETKGVAASTDTTYSAVRENVEYQLLAALYNDYVELFMEADEYVVTDQNAERMEALVVEYLEYSED